MFGDVVSENPLVEYNGMFGKLKFSNNLGNVRGIITEFVKNIAKSGAACFKRLNKNMSDDPYYGYEYGYSKATTEDNYKALISNARGIMKFSNREFKNINEVKEYLMGL